MSQCKDSGGYITRDDPVFMDPGKGGNTKPTYPDSLQQGSASRAGPMLDKIRLCLTVQTPLGPNDPHLPKRQMPQEKGHLDQHTL